MDPRHTIAGTLEYLVAREREVNYGRPQDLAGGKDAMRAYFAAMVVELSELMQELDWKPWKTKEVIDKAAVADEFADFLAFAGVLTANVMAQTGLTPDDLAQAFERKTSINIQRARGEVDGYIPADGVNE